MIKRLLDEAYQKAKKVLSENRDKLELLATTLMEKETLDSAEVRKLLSLPDEKTVVASQPVAV